MAEHRGASAPGRGGTYAINLESFTKRLKVFYSHWKENRTDHWGSSDALVVATPPVSEDLRYLKSSALNMWLLGLEFPETIIVLMNKQIHFLCTQKKASVLATLKKPAKVTVGTEIVMHVKAKSDDGTALMDEMLGAIRAQLKSSGHDYPVVGYLAKEAPEGNLLETWNKKLKTSNFQLADVTNGFSELFSVKESNEITNVKKAAILTSSVMKYHVVPKLEKIIDEEIKVSHSTLMDDAEKSILEPARVKVKLRAENVDICYPPIFQSGGVFDLKPSASSNDDKLYYDSTSVIVCAIGSRYNNYCSNIARSFLIDANPIQIKAYEVLLKAHEAAIASLKPGNKTSTAYHAAFSVVEKDAPEFTPNLTKTAGTGIGLEFRESGWSLNSKNDRLLKVGMIFNVSLGFQNLQTQTNNPKTEQFSLMLADTVIVNQKHPEVLTSFSSKAVKDVAYSFNEEEEEEEKTKTKVESKGSDAFLSKATLRSDRQDTSKEAQRKQHQTELARKKNEETRHRLIGGGSGSSDVRRAARSSSDLIAYKNINEIPCPRDLMIHIDQKNEAILLPIYGSMVPFHVATIKRVYSQQDNYIRIIFDVPGTAFNPHDKNSLKFQGSIYLKEVSFRSKDPKHITEIVQVITTFRRQVKSRESERAQRATLVSQEKLQLAGTKFKHLRLPDLWIRPSFGGRGRKLSGTLEAHVNGFRYSTSRKDEQVDVMYGNIKHAFFQPAEKEMITLLHFHLHNHIMVGNRKTKDVQFYVEVMDVVQTLGGSRRSANDPDEIEEEQRERDRKNRINLDFENFVNKVSDLWGQPPLRELDLEFDVPCRDLGFHGVPYKASAFIVPTSVCLVELVENPFLVITVSEIEIVNLERVGLGQKSFDMAIVFKDFKKDILRIDSIPSTSLDNIKDWLDLTDLKYYESKLNLSWKSILKNITDDPEKFFEEGGWEVFNNEATDSDSENTEDSDQGYLPSDVQSDSVSEEEDDDSESLVESEEDIEEDTEEDLEEEEGKTWEELEREASNADREKGDESDSEEDRQRRKIKAFRKSGIPDKRDPRGGPPKRPKLR
ncbi:Fact complex subunit spt16 [Thalictrum thalictroides]|uniref:FACT complex subunit n=1 Tax=Thalictrum thalictroides TaxID=46969 RepID=A0A7J6URA0_THATH|nr:Fact complex subunit spt16 [Thalictrum thalictroides]